MTITINDKTIDPLLVTDGTSIPAYFSFAAYETFMPPRCDMLMTWIGPILKIEFGCV